MYVQQPPIDRVSSLCSDLSATIRLETTVPLFPPNRVSVAFVYTSSLFVPRKSSVGRARLTRTNWQNSANKHLLVTMLFSSFFFFPFSFLPSTIDLRLARTRFPSPLRSRPLYFAVMCRIRSLSSAVSFYRTPRCSTVRERMSSGIDGRQDRTG